ncbi:MAG: hypothetical protein VB095_03055 [Anaerovorax sp.]|nr:hypothetical protein [Anaerovorax sp.]
MKRYEHFKKLKMNYIAAGIFSGVGCIVMVLFPEIALESANRGISLWATSVLPALLPFFICAGFMVSLGVPKIIGRYFEPLFRTVFRVPGNAAFVFLVSITSGYPMGPKIISDLYRQKQITKLDAKRMLSFCSTSGPLFLLGTVGVSMLHSAALGVSIAISHYAGAILNGIIFCHIPTAKHENSGLYSNKIYKKQIEEIGCTNLLVCFTEAILSALRTLGIICGYLVLFCLLTDFMQFCGLLQLFPSQIGKSLFRGFFEMTVGCNSISLAEGVSAVSKCAVASFLISFGGLSIMAQSMSLLSGLGITPWTYLEMKLSHGILSALIALLITPHCLKSAVVTGAFGVSLSDVNFSIAYGLLFSTKMVIMMILLILILIVLNEWIIKKEKSHEGSRNHSRI